MTNTPNDENTYYKIRDEMKVNSCIDNAKRFYYLRKTCFRGMLRYNRDGKFNIPYGKYKTINYEEVKNTKYKGKKENNNLNIIPFSSQSND